ncbi:hypothetical protein [Paenibacillus radicis (ex Xue et al. 2023)]|uniref:Uncharacterized protein n=1 Tax=Paenibacillus radicis (ex Xue et al. 2023) TaxID=2972489 RepID=A0ABT1YGM4_9BACL|nr:hypothetical protein [Paenibacillus radicis (ex Xue et al. 2023)]MCR8631363.1 hypothetical protein [Paenibacillus radicis (ex Xue et al. 2023)]
MKRIGKRGIFILSNKDIQTFVKRLAFSDDHLLEEFTLTLDGRELSHEDARKFIAFIRAERSSNRT